MLSCYNIKLLSFLYNFMCGKKEYALFYHFCKKKKNLKSVASNRLYIDTPGLNLVQQISFRNHQTNKKRLPACILYLHSALLSQYFVEAVFAVSAAADLLLYISTMFSTSTYLNLKAFSGSFSQLQSADLVEQITLHLAAELKSALTC
ncbi:hypothetical protein ILYODFUR_003813 [Ilyodon furcidens]|uniref:Uncharacterized protein n=1 Tax=Ilyodon furcidens TaxID=33524 RepID=A0ABV0VBC6_9TELE